MKTPKMFLKATLPLAFVLGGCAGPSGADDASTEEADGAQAITLSGHTKRLKVCKVAEAEDMKKASSNIEMGAAANKALTCFVGANDSTLKQIVKNSRDCTGGLFCAPAADVGRAYGNFETYRAEINEACKLYGAASFGAGTGIGLAITQCRIGLELGLASLIDGYVDLGERDGRLPAVTAGETAYPSCYVKAENDSQQAMNAAANQAGDCAQAQVLKLGEPLANSVEAALPARDVAAERENARAMIAAVNARATELCIDLAYAGPFRGGSMNGATVGNCRADAAGQLGTAMTLEVR